MPLDSNNEIYVDNAATTSMSKDVLDSMLPYFSNNYGNPSSLYSLAQISRDAVEASRETISNILQSYFNCIITNNNYYNSKFIKKRQFWLYFEYNFR